MVDPETQTGTQTNPETEQDPTPQLPLLTLRDGLPAVVEDPERLALAVADLAQGEGPIALDAERASGYRYSARAYLIQLRRTGSTTWLIDPIGLRGEGELDGLREVLDGPEWILHAASQDLPCLRELGLEARSLFDTELAARLLGYPRVGLASLVEVICERRMRKEHSAADWSKRPLPSSWLDYAALDVEVLVEIRDHLARELDESGKREWARQEFEHTLGYIPVPRVDPWRRTSGMHRARGRRSVAAVRELWTARDEIAADRDVTPGRVIPDRAIVAAANALPQDRDALLSLRDFNGRGAARYARTWLAALQRARTMPDSELPPTSLRSDGPPPARAWVDRNPEAAARLATARRALTTLSEELSVPVENLLTPDLVRRTLWSPPSIASAEDRARVGDRLADQLSAAGARRWQIELIGPLLERAITDPEPLAAPEQSPRTRTPKASNSPNPTEIQRAKPTANPTASPDHSGPD